MFALRQVGDHREKNTIIGNEYEFVGSSSHKKEFKILHDHIIEGEIPDNGGAPIKENHVFAFISHGAVSIPIYSHDKNYIMCSDGKTFERLNHH